MSNKKIDALVNAIVKRTSRKIASTLVAQIEYGTIKKANDDGTCDVQMLTDKEGDITESISCMFSANMKMKPTVGSKCLVAHIMNEDAEGLIVWCEKIDEVYFNGDELGGLVKAKELKTQIDKNTNAIKAIQQAFNSWVTVPNDGGAALKALSNQFTSQPLADLSNIESNKLKHGEG